MTVTVGIRNLDKFIGSLDTWIEKVQDETMHVANGIVATIFHDILQRSAQSSGDFAGNWQYSINYVNTTFNELNLRDQGKPLFKVGDHQAITYAKAMNRGRDKGYKIGDTFYLSNSAEHEEPYAMKIERNQIDFRYPNQGETRAKAIKNIVDQYSKVSKMQAQILKRKKL